MNEIKDLEIELTQEQKDKILVETKAKEEATKPKLEKCFYCQLPIEKEEEIVSYLRNPIEPAIICHENCLNKSKNYERR